MSKQPYVYILQHIDPGAVEDRYYIGVKFGKDADPTQLLNGLHEKPYWTSSSIVQTLAKQGLYKVRSVMLCNTQEEAQSLELKWLRKVGVPKNKMFANRSLAHFAYDNDRIMQTIRDRFGVDYPMQSPEVRETRRCNNIEKYGVDHHLKTEESMERLRQTNQKKYGCDYIMQSPEKVEVRRQNNQKRYGVDSPFQLPETKERVRNTNLERYGNAQYVNSEEGARKIKEMSLEKYGVDHYMGSKEIQQKLREGRIKSTGYAISSQSPQARQKLRESTLERRSRPIVEEIKLFLKSRNLTLSRGWPLKNTGSLEQILYDLKIEHGELG